MREQAFRSTVRSNVKSKGLDFNKLDSVRATIRKELSPEDQEVEDDSMEIKPGDFDSPPRFDPEDVVRGHASPQDGQITPGNLHLHQRESFQGYQDDARSVDSSGSKRSYYGRQQNLPQVENPEPAVRFEREDIGR